MLKMFFWKAKKKTIEWLKDETSASETSEKAAHILIGLIAAFGVGFLVMQYLKSTSTSVLGKMEDTATNGFGPDSPPAVLGSNGASWSR